jgi:hypothetical protein
MTANCWFCGHRRRVWWFATYWAVCQPCIDNSFPPQVGVIV